MYRTSGVRPAVKVDQLVSGVGQIFQQTVTGERNKAMTLRRRRTT